MISTVPAGPQDRGILIMAPIDCSVCDSLDLRVHFPDELGNQPALVDCDFKPETQRVYQIVRCTECDFIYTNPVPDPEPAYIRCEIHTSFFSLAPLATSMRPYKILSPTIWFLRLSFFARRIVPS